MTKINKYLVYVKKFKAKRELATELEEGRVYQAVEDGELINIMLEDGSQFLVHKTIQSGDAFDADIVPITQANHHEFSLTPEDSETVLKTIISPIIDQARKEFEEKQDKMVDSLMNDIGDLLAVDVEIIEATANVISHIKKTHSDKYEAEMVPAVDLYGLMRYSPHGKGYNIGNASKYLKRYLTNGFEKSSNPQDLYKAAHYILFEIARLNNSKNEEA
jgi:hypothetical protein